MNFTQIEIEEFEAGAWVADVVSLEAFDGSFSLDGATWTGTAVSTRQDSSNFYTRVIGGKNKLATVIPDKYYSGNVSLQTAVGDACREAGESVGTIEPGKFLNNFERLMGPLSLSLDSLANVFGLMWWVDRSGVVNMQTARPSGGDANGNRVSSDTDASIVLVDPQGVTLGGSYGSSDVVAKMPKIRHVRWNYNPKRYSAQLYAVPFIFRNPVPTIYDCVYSASVDKDNGDGTIDVIAAGRFGVTRVPYYTGIPGSKIKAQGGEAVMLGFFGGDPQKPFCLGMAQDSSASKQVARNGDSVKVTIDSSVLVTLAPLITAPPGPAGGPCLPTPGPPASVDITGTITSGTSRISVGD